jgi:hypothetical protein
MSIAVVDGGGPVLRDRCIRRDAEPVAHRTVEWLAVAVHDRHEIELALAEVLGAEECEAVSDGPRKNRVSVGLLEVGLDGLDQLWERR